MKCRVCILIVTLLCLSSVLPSCKEKKVVSCDKIVKPDELPPKGQIFYLFNPFFYPKIGFINATDIVGDKTRFLVTLLGDNADPHYVFFTLSKEYGDSGSGCWPRGCRPYTATDKPIDLTGIKVFQKQGGNKTDVTAQFIVEYRDLAKLMEDYNKDRNGEAHVNYLRKELNGLSTHDLKWFPATFTLQTSLANNKGLELVIAVKDHNPVSIVLSKE